MKTPSWNRLRRPFPNGHPNFNIFYKIIARPYIYIYIYIPIIANQRTNTMVTHQGYSRVNRRTSNKAEIRTTNFQTQYLLSVSGPDFRPANFRRTFFRPQIFVPHFFVTRFFVPRFFVVYFFVLTFFRPLIFSFRHFLVWPTFRSCNSSSIHFFVLPLLHQY